MANTLDEYDVLDAIAENHNAMLLELNTLRNLRGTYPYKDNWNYGEDIVGANGGGVEKYGFKYLDATRAAIQVAEEFNMDVEREQVQLFLTRVVVAILDSQNK